MVLNFLEILSSHKSSTLQEVVRSSQKVCKGLVGFVRNANEGTSRCGRARSETRPSPRPN